MNVLAKHPRGIRSIEPRKVRTYGKSIDIYGKGFSVSVTRNPGEAYGFGIDG